jgi:SRSO17 transposase
MMSELDEFEAYIAELATALGHADREVPFRGYTTGLLLPLERKSVEPMAARVEPARVGAAHQSLHHFVAKAEWSDAALLAAVRASVLPAIVGHGPIEAWIVDDTGMPKKGRHSVGVARQYCGQLGKQENCQVAVSLSVANVAASLPVAWRLYLPREWAENVERRTKAGVPAELAFQTKPAMALEQIEAALAAGIPRGVVLADAGYGADTKFQARLAELGLEFVVGVQPRAKIWINGKQPLPPKAWSRQGRPPSNLRRDADHQPIEAKTWAMQLPPEAWQDIVWREGTKGELVSRFTYARIRPAHRDYWRNEPWPELTVLAEWPGGEAEPTKIWFANIHVDTSLEHLVHLAKLRWRIERDYLELKQELGLSHYEGRGWRGFHHHASLCIAAYGYLIKERLALSPSGKNRPGSKQVALPKTYIPRGSPRKTREAYPKLHRHHARPHRHPLGSHLAAMSMLHAASRRRCQFMTQ